MSAREKILEESTGLFLRYGVKSITMDDIASNLGISKKTLYQFVDNKTDLIYQVCHQHIMAEKAIIDKIVSDSKDAIDEILSIAAYVTNLLRQLSPTTVYDLQKYYKASWKVMEGLHNEHVYHVIKNNVDRGIKEGLYRDDLDADIIAKLYVGKTNMVVDPELFPLKEYNLEKLFSEYIHYHIHGIASQKGLTLLRKHH